MIKGPNIVSLPKFEGLGDALRLPILLKLGDNISTDDILPAGSRVLPYRSNIPKISEFCFDGLDGSYLRAARDAKSGHAIVAGRNYGQGSSREHAALAPRFLGLRLVIAKDFARIHWQNLINYGVVPLRFANPADYDVLAKGDTIEIQAIQEGLRTRSIQAVAGNRSVKLVHDLSTRQINIILAGGYVNWKRTRYAEAHTPQNVRGRH